MGNNRGAAFRLGVKEEAGCWLGKKGGKSGSPYSTSHLVYPKCGGLGGFCWEIQNGGGKDATPRRSPYPPGAPHLLRFLVLKVGFPLVVRN